MSDLQNRVKIKILKGILSASDRRIDKASLAYINELENKLNTIAKDSIMHYDRLIKANLSKTFAELRDHGTHDDFCDKINDIRTEAILRYSKTK